MNPARIGRTLEDFEVGQVYQHPLGRTIMETDNTWFTLLTMNTHQVHFNADYAGRTEFGAILVNSALTIALVLGQTVSDISQNAVANLEMTDIKLLRPVFVGDTLYAETICTDVRRTRSRPDAGIVKTFTRGVNQRGEVVLSFKRTVMVRTRASAESVGAFPIVTDGPLQLEDLESE